MELQELLRAVHEMIAQMIQAEKALNMCKVCKGERDEEAHVLLHRSQASAIRGRLPHSLVWNFEELRVEIRSFTLDVTSRGSVHVKLNKVDIR